MRARARSDVVCGTTTVTAVGGVAWAQPVGITGVEPVGNYALRLLFDDGHNTGLYTWTLLHELGRDRAANWARYRQRCAEAAKAPAPPPKPRPLG